MRGTQALGVDFSPGQCPLLLVEGSGTTPSITNVYVNRTIGCCRDCG